MRGWIVVVGVLLCGTASAQNAIILSVESSDPSVEADALRESLSEAVELPVVGLAGSETPIALIVVSVARGEDATVIATAQGTPQRHSIARSDSANWLRDGLVALVQAIQAQLEGVDTLRSRERYALMSWSGGMRPRREPRLLRPWPWEAGRPAALDPDEVGGEVGSALSAPRPRGHVRFD